MKFIHAISNMLNILYKLGIENYLSAHTHSEFPVSC